MSRAEFLDHLSTILELPSGSLSGDEKLSDLEEWTSLAMIGFIAFGDEQFEKTLSPRQVGACETVKDLGALVGVEG